MKKNAAIVSGQQTQFQLVRPGLTKAPGTVSIMSVGKPGWYLRATACTWSQLPIHATAGYLLKTRPSPSESIPSLVATQHSSPSTIRTTIFHSTNGDGYTFVILHAPKYSKRVPASPPLLVTGIVRILVLF